MAVQAHPGQQTWLRISCGLRLAEQGGVSRAVHATCDTAHFAQVCVSAYTATHRGALGAVHFAAFPACYSRAQHQGKIERTEHHVVNMNHSGFMFKNIKTDLVIGAWLPVHVQVHWHPICACGIRCNTHQLGTCSAEDESAYAHAANWRL